MLEITGVPAARAEDSATDVKAGAAAGSIGHAAIVPYL